jgi:hypothetical protein
MIQEQTENITFKNIEKAFYFVTKKIDKGEYMIEKSKVDLYNIEIKTEGDLGEIRLKFELIEDKSKKEDMQEKINELGEIVEELRKKLERKKKENIENILKIDSIR